MNITITMPGLKEVEIKEIEQVEDGVAIHVEIPVRVQCCPRCGNKTKRIHDYRIQKIKHLKWFERFTYIFCFMPIIRALYFLMVQIPFTKIQKPSFSNCHSAAESSLNMKFLE